MDPPFGPVNEDVYFGVGEDLPEYLAYMKERVEHLTRGLTNFNFVLHVNWRASHYLKVEVDKVLGRKNFRNEITWVYSGPSVAGSHLPRKHDVLLWWGTGQYPFNPLRIPYKEGLSVGGVSSWHGDVLDAIVYKERGKLIEDWWADIPSLCRNEKEKLGYPTQKPAKLLNRVVSMFSNPGDLVLDPMMGSGTTGRAALSQGRRFLGCDLTDFAASRSLA